nr:MAG TPA: hypothetical protein [Caudoviricetes sp.]
MICLPTVYYTAPTGSGALATISALYCLYYSLIRMLSHLRLR